MLSYSLILKTLADTENLAKLIKDSIFPKFTIALNGNLGSGKTTLTRMILHAFGVTGSVKSPTYALVESYQVQEIIFCHFDLYRFNEPDEWLYGGFDEYFTSQSICFIEWAEKAQSFIPIIDWQIYIVVKNEDRVLTISSNTFQGDQCLNILIKNVADS